MVFEIRWDGVFFLLRFYFIYFVLIIWLFEFLNSLSLRIIGFLYRLNFLFEMFIVGWFFLSFGVNYFFGNYR